MYDNLSIEEINERINLREQLLEIDAPKMFKEFLPYINPSYSRQWYHTLIADKCQALIEGKIKNLMIFVPPQHGKALAIDTPILTANRGWCAHGDLRVNDYVFAPNGQIVRVEAVTHHYLCESSIVAFAEGDPIMAANRHEWGCYIPNSSHKAIYYPRIETQEIKAKTKDRSPYIRATEPLEYNEKNLLIPPYLFGLWLGDGAARHKQICKSVDDCNYFLSQHNGRIVRQSDNVAYITFDELNTIKLKAIGVLGAKHIPTDYQQSSIQQRMALLQGLMDTDGSCDTRGNCEIVQTNEILANGILELLRGLGYKPRTIQGDAKINGRTISKKYRICFNPNRKDIVFRLPRKAERLRNKRTQDRDDKRKHFIKSITPCGEQMVNCIQVEGGYYLAGRELRPTHNSEILSRNFPAWAFGYNPDLKIVGCSYSSDLAKQFSRSIQRIMDSKEYQKIFPETRLNSSNLRTVARGYLRNVNMFEIVGRKGFYKAQGVCGSLTGTAVDIAIIDDPVKDAIEAYSATYRERVWDWYTSVLMTRLHNNSKQLFIMTRWHEDDLAGRILAREADRWEVVSIPAICEVENDGGISKRHVGEALWEGRHSLERLLAAQQRSPRVFTALYQQHPTADGGNIIKSAWFEKMSEADFLRHRRNEPINFFLDTAYTDKTNNDPSGIIAVCYIDDVLYITHAKKMLMKFPELVRFIPQYVKEHGYNLRSAIRIEPKANGLSVIDQLQEATSLNVMKTPTPKESKETRLNAVSPIIEGKRVVLVEGTWNDEFIDEVCGFPVKPHDEFVDVMCYAIDHYFNSPYKPIDLKRLQRLI